MLSRILIAFLPRSMHLLTSCLQSQSAVILQPKKVKSITIYTYSPSICHEMMGQDVRVECKESWAQKNWRFWTRLLRVPWTVSRSNQSILKEISPVCSLEGLMLKWNSNTLATWCEELTHLKRPWCWERLRAGGEGATEDEMVGWHHRLDGLGFGWSLGVGDGQGGLACCGSWGHKESDTTEWLNWTDITLPAKIHIVKAMVFQ